MKRTLSLVLALVMVLGTFTGVFAAADETALDLAAEVLEREGVLKGDGDDLMLDNDLLRRDMVVLVSRLMKAEALAEEFDASELTFEDITDNHYNGYLAWSVENNIIEGHDEKTFGFNESVTVQDFAVVLLRVLGYEVTGHEPWKAAFANAKKLGLLDNVDVEEKDEVVRGVMAVMTFNALGTAMYDTDETLAEFLDITMPVKEVTELTADVNDTENLAEIVVELSNADLADIERLENKANYRLNDNKIEIKDAKVVGDNVVLTLASINTTKGELETDNQHNLVKNKKYTLSIRGIAKEIDGTYDFKAYDNTAPAIESVVSLGEYGIKVTTTEPVVRPSERNFEINGRVVTMKVEQYGRDIILTPYGSAKFELGETELTVLELRDYAGYRSSAIVENFEVVADDVAPEVVSVTRPRTGNSVTVVFDKDVRNASVSGYDNYKDVGNISYRDGRQFVYAEGIQDLAGDDVEYAAKKVATNVVVYRFKNSLPRNVEFTIENVENHSKVKMEKYVGYPTISLEDEIAEVVNNQGQLTFNPNTDQTIVASNGTNVTVSSVNVVIKFDRDVDKPETTKTIVGGVTTDTKKYTNNFKLYERYVDPKYALTELTEEELADAILNVLGATPKFVDGKFAIANVDYAKDAKGNDIKNELVVTMLGLQNNVNRSNEYILEMFGLTDRTNVIARAYVDFQVRPVATLSVVSTSVYMNEIGTETVEFEVKFSAKVDKDIAENGENYIFTVNGRPLSLVDVGGRADLHNNGTTLTIRVYKSLEEINNDFSAFKVSSAIRTLGGTLINAETPFITKIVTNNASGDVIGIEFR